MPYLYAAAKEFTVLVVCSRRKAESPHSVSRWRLHDPAMSRHLYKSAAGQDEQDSDYHVKHVDIKNFRSVSSSSLKLMLRGDANVD